MSGDPQVAKSELWVGRRQWFGKDGPAPPSVVTEMWRP